MSKEITEKDPVVSDDRPQIVGREREDSHMAATQDPRTGDAIARWYEKKLADGYEVRPLRRIGRFIEVVESSRAGEPSRIAFLRQNSVFILPVIEIRGKLFTLLGEEYREGAARKTVGFPAGSLDKGGESLLEVAKRELLEETPLKEEWISGMSEIYVGGHNYVSPGGTNEQIFYVRADVRLPEDMDITDLEGLISGVEAEGEHIVSHVRELTHDLVYELEISGQKLALLLMLRELEEKKQ